MNMAKLRVIAVACGFLLLAFSASANAQGNAPVDSGVYVESWSFEGGRELPVLSFDGAFDRGQPDDDIRAENIIQDKDGSTRFQLSHRGPLSRQVFANVRSIAQEDGFTRNIITNIADGDQTEYLSRTVVPPALVERDKIRDSSAPDRLAKTGDQDTECVTCILIIASSIACVLAEKRSFQQCRQNCQYQGGIMHFEPGLCGAVSTECMCWSQPREIAIEF